LRALTKQLQTGYQFRRSRQFLFLTFITGHLRGKTFLKRLPLSKSPCAAFEHKKASYFQTDTSGALAGCRNFAPLGVAVCRCHREGDVPWDK
jgi:hypothetical protein